MAAIESEPGTETGRGHVGPGMLLRKARENAGISALDVAAQLHLDVRTIAALERDAFDDLPAPTFVRGYLRGYARLLNVPVSPVMEAYDREGFHPPDLVADIAEKPQAQSGDLPVRMLTYLIVVVLAGLVVWWWYDREMAGTAPTLAVGTASESAATGPVSAGTGASAETAAGSVRPEPASAAAGQSGQGTGASSQQAPAAGDKDATDSPRASQATPAGTPKLPPLDINKRVESELAKVERSLAATAPGSPSPEAESPTAPAAAGAAATTAGAGDATKSVRPRAPAAPAKASVRLDFPIEAWVEIHDRSGEKLFFNLVKPGRVLELNGDAPIRILLGRSKGVTLQFNGEPVDLKPHIRKGGVAQLTLGE